jgi:hypothetical protein
MRNSVLLCLCVGCLLVQFHTACLIVTISALQYASHKRPAYIAITCDSWRCLLPVIIY